jgi:hypothetical protein
MNSFALIDEQGAINFLQMLLEHHPKRAKNITPREKCIVKAILSDRTYQQVGSMEAYSEGSLQNAASKLFRDLDYLLCTKVDRKNFKVTIGEAMTKSCRQESTAVLATNLWILAGRSQVITINNKLESSQSFSVLSLLNSYSPLFTRTFCYQAWKEDPLVELMIGLVGNAGAAYAQQLIAGAPQAIEYFIKLLKINPSLVIVEYDTQSSNKSFETQSACMHLLWNLVTKAHNSCIVLVNAPAYFIDEVNNRLQITPPAGHQLPRCLAISGYESRCFEIISLYLK